MNTRYFSPREISDFILDDRISDDIQKTLSIGICSIADLLDLCELEKKRGTIGRSINIIQRLGDFIIGPVRLGQITLIGLDKDLISQSLFWDDDGELKLWKDGTERGSLPVSSIRCITLRCDIDTAWWSYRVYEEMKEYFSGIE